MNKNKIIGLIGGMGPYASAYFYKLLLKKSGDLYGVKNNNDYPEILIDSVPVPDFISNTKQLDIARKILISRIKKLNNFGCKVIAIVCNTAHILYPELSNYSRANFLSLIDLVTARAKKLGMKKVGLLATRTTIELKIYETGLSKMGIQVINPSKQIQKVHEEIIRKTIATEETNLFKEKLYKTTQEFISKEHLDGVILGCTELPLVFPTDRFNNAIDCLDILADELLNIYFKDTREKIWG